MTILYVNGDSHAAGAEAVNTYAFAEDDPKLHHLGRQPHPDNLELSWGAKLSELLGYSLVCDAESASSNNRIIRTTKEWINGQTSNDVLVVIGWSTWEREEWLVDGEYYQVNASGIDIVPPAYQDKYKEYVLNVNWNQKTTEAHARIWDFHNWLNSRGIRHLFFNSNTDFARIVNQLSWEANYIRPYSSCDTYHKWLQYHGFNTVNKQSYHYGPDAHLAWANFLEEHIFENSI